MTDSERSGEVENLVSDTKRLGRLTARYLERVRDVQLDQFSSASKWLPASLLAVNGGGVLATTNGLSNANLSTLPAVIFSIGLLFALLSGVAMQHVSESLVYPTNKYLHYFEEVAETGERDKESESTLNKSIKRVERWGLLPPAIGWISGVMFLSGILALASDVHKRSAKNESRCLSVQQDMLSRNPSLRDGPAIFQSLGCRAQ